MVLDVHIDITQLRYINQFHDKKIILVFEGRWGWGLYRKGKKKQEKCFKIPNRKYYKLPHLKNWISADKRKYLKLCLISDAN